MAVALGQNMVCPSFISIGFEESALLRCFRTGLSWQDILMPGGHPLAMLKRKPSHQQFLLKCLLAEHNDLGTGVHQLSPAIVAQGRYYLLFQLDNCLSLDSYISHLLEGRDRLSLLLH